MIESAFAHGSSCHKGRLRSAWLLLPARVKPPPVALQVLPLGVNARLRWDRLHLSLSVKRPSQHLARLSSWEGCPTWGYSVRTTLTKKAHNEPSELYSELADKTSRSDDWPIQDTVIPRSMKVAG